MSKADNWGLSDKPMGRFGKSKEDPAYGLSGNKKRRKAKRAKAKKARKRRNRG